MFYVYSLNITWTITFGLVVIGISLIAKTISKIIMNDYLKKFKLVMPTYLLVMVGTVFAMALIRWLFTIQFSIIDIKIEIWEFLVPFILSWIVIHFLLKPKFKNLKIRNDAIGRKIEILCIVPWFILFIMIIRNVSH